MVTSEIPCSVLLPYNGDCTSENISVYNNASTFLYSEDMFQYNSFLCNATFNQSSIGTYTLLFSTGDSASFIVEEDVTMYFFNLTVYGVMFAGIITMIAFMHVFNKKEHQMSPIVFGAVATALSVISLAMLASGFSIVKDIVFIIDVNYYFMVLFLGFAIYTVSAGVSLYRDVKPREQQQGYYG
jgi:hypothetical protein